MNFSLVILFLCIVFVNSFVHINRIVNPVSISRSFKISSTSDRELLIEACKTRNVDRVALLSLINKILKDANKNNISDKSIEGTKWECIFCNVAGGAANGFVLGGILFQLT
jgi:hypothetical protein